MRRQLAKQGFRVRKFGRLGIIRVIDNREAGLCIATHQLIKSMEFIIQVGAVPPYVLGHLKLPARDISQEVPGAACFWRH